MSTRNSSRRTSSGRNTAQSSAVETLSSFRDGVVRWIRHDLRPKNRRTLISRYLFPAAFLWWEFVFKLSTTRQPGLLSPLYIFLFSLCWGLLFYLLTTNLKAKINRIVRMVLLFLLSLPYIVEYFVYRQFKVLYDLNTVRNGAGGVATGFMDDVRRLVFSPSGLFHIFLFLLPFLIYVILWRKVDRAKRIKMPRRIRAAVATAALFVFSLILVLLPSSYRSAYSSEYNFQTAAGHFGLATGLRLEVRKGMFGGSGVSFTEVVQEEETEEAPKEEVPKVYGNNVLDLDFSQLAASASGTNAELDTYVASLSPSKQNEYTGIFKGKNLIMITAEAFSGKMISKTLTPTLYRLATKGIRFTDYNLQATAGTTGGEYQHFFGMLPTEGGSSMKITANYHNELTMGTMLNRFGYYGKAYHNNTYTFSDRDKTHINLGYSDGYMGKGNGMENYLTPAWPESDLEMFQCTFPEYCDKAPFNIYYMTVSGHSEYDFSNNQMAKKNKDLVQGLEFSDRVKAYIACNLELEAGLTWLVNALEEKGIADDTVIVITGDHFPYGLDENGRLGSMPYLSELYGYEVNNYLERDLNRLIIWSGSLEKEESIRVTSPVSAIDILPTLANLFGTEYDSRLFPGRDVFSNTEPLVFNLNYDWKTDKGSFINATKTFTPTDPSETVSDEYISRIRSLVRNKINYMTGFLKTDYFGHVFADYTFRTEKVSPPVHPQIVTVYETDDSGETIVDEAGQPVPVTDEAGEVMTTEVYPETTEAPAESSGEAAEETASAGSGGLPASQSLE